MVIRQISKLNRTKKSQILTKFDVSRLKPQVELTDIYEMMHKAWSSIEEVPYCFWRSSVKFQGRTGPNLTEINPKLGVFGL